MGGSRRSRSLGQGADRLALGPAVTTWRLSSSPTSESPGSEWRAEKEVPPDIGATVIGRHLFDLVKGWEGQPPAGDHVVVVSHRPKPEGTQRSPGGSSGEKFSRAARGAAQLRPRWTPAPDLVILMTMSESLPLAEVKAHLSELVGRVGNQHERVTVTVHGRPAAVLVAVDDLDAMEETIALLSDSAALRALADSDAELARGEGEDEQNLAAAMRARRASA
jgi:antitoxin YefM